MTDASGSQPPGWYHAQGDPPGTQRYWDGGEWQGGPQAAGQASMSGLGARRAAPNGKRFTAFVIDIGIAVAIYVVGFVLASAIADVLVFVALLGYLGYVFYNFWYLQGTTGQTIGKKHQGIVLLREDSQQPVGLGMAFVRSLLQGLFAIPCYLDHWWILVDDDNRRLSDKVLKFHVYEA